MAFKPKIGRPKRKQEEEESEEPEEEIEEVEEEEDIEEPEEVEETTTKPAKQKDTLAKQELADIIEGNLNRALQLLQYLRV